MILNPVMKLKHSKYEASMKKTKIQKKERRMYETLWKEHFNKHRCGLS